MKHRRDCGESLIEVVMTIVIISISVTALIASLATAATSATTRKKVQTADVVIRDYAEAIKSAAATCTAGASYAPDTSFLSDHEGFSVSWSADDSLPGTCPDPTAVQILTLSVTPPTGVDKTMQIAVRTP